MTCNLGRPVEGCCLDGGRGSHFDDQEGLSLARERLVCLVSVSFQRTVG